MKILFWVQHLLGVGHVRRASLLAQALAAAGDEVTVALGGFPVPAMDFGGARVAQLPPARVADARFRPILGEGGAPIDEAWRARRAEALQELTATTQPDCLLLETFPFGRRAFRFELQPVLEATRARRPRPLVAASVRDILVAKNDPAKDRAMAEAARRYCDLVLVHGDPGILPLSASFPFAGEIAHLIRHTGFVAPSRVAHAVSGEGAGEIVVSVGGGAVGGALLRIAAAAGAREPARRWRLLAGHDLPPDDFAALRAKAASNVTVERARPDFPALLARAALSISQAGYNTVLDVLAAGCRAILVPFAERAETEQTLRANLLAERGRATALPTDGLTADTLAAAVRRALAQPAPGPVEGLRMNGAAESVRILHACFAKL